MHRYMLTRLCDAFLSLMLLSITIFVMIRMTGDPVILMADLGAKEDQRAHMNRYGPPGANRTFLTTGGALSTRPPPRARDSVSPH
jgi:ABC-type dipeptide/oligopeptide/nickel transport system permease component